MGGVFAALVWWTPSFRLPGGDFPLMLYAIWVAGYCFHQVRHLFSSATIPVKFGHYICLCLPSGVSVLHFLALDIKVELQ